MVAAMPIHRVQVKLQLVIEVDDHPTQTYDYHKLTAASNQFFFDEASGDLRETKIEMTYHEEMMPEEGSFVIALKPTGRQFLEMKMLMLMESVPEFPNGELYRITTKERGVDD